MITNILSIPPPPTWQNVTNSQALLAMLQLLRLSKKNNFKE